MAVESFHTGRAVGTKPGKRSHRISDQLRREIVLGQLEPRDVLLELELADRFGCSQSTVRESLLTLHEEGLVVRRPHRGTQVAECLRDDMIELIRLRHDIETRGIVRAITHYDRLMHRALSGLVEAMISAACDEDEYLLSVLDRQFHLRLYEQAALPSVEPILRRCLIHNHRYKILNTERHKSLLETAERHLPIIDAMAAGDTEKAVHALSLHITTIVDVGASILGPGSRSKGTA